MDLRVLEQDPAYIMERDTRNLVVGGHEKLSD